MGVNKLKSKTLFNTQISTWANKITQFITNIFGRVSHCIYLSKRIEYVAIRKHEFRNKHSEPIQHSTLHTNQFKLYKCALFTAWGTTKWAAKKNGWLTKIINVNFGINFKLKYIKYICSCTVQSFKHLKLSLYVFFILVSALFH